MRKSARSHRKNVEDPDMDLVPIMNMFLVLIPFLLMFASFYHMKAINTSIPVLSNTSGDLEKKQNPIKVMVFAELKKNEIYLYGTSDELTSRELERFENHFQRDAAGNYPMEAFGTFLSQIKSKYPQSDTLVLIPSALIIYDTIIQTMDVARSMNEQTLFPNVVISGKV